MRTQFFARDPKRQMPNRANASGHLDLDVLHIDTIFSRIEALIVWLRVSCLYQLCAAKWGLVLMNIVY